MFDVPYGNTKPFPTHHCTGLSDRSLIGILDMRIITENCPVNDNQPYYWTPMYIKILGLLYLSSFVVD